MTVDPSSGGPNCSLPAKSQETLVPKRAPVDAPAGAMDGADIQDLVGNQTVHGFDLCDTRNDKADCVVKSGANSLLIFTKTTFCSFRASQSQIHAQFFPHKVLECHTKQYLQIPIWGVHLGHELFSF